jgi:hypothetical protein
MRKTVDRAKRIAALGILCAPMFIAGSAAQSSTDSVGQAVAALSKIPAIQKSVKNDAENLDFIIRVGSSQYLVANCAIGRPYPGEADHKKYFANGEDLGVRERLNGMIGDGARLAIYGVIVEQSRGVDSDCELAKGLIDYTLR